MRLSLDMNLARELRRKFNERDTFSFHKSASLSKAPQSQAHQNAFNAVCAVLNRIDSLTAHCCSLEMDLPDADDSVFAFCDLLNYGQTLIDCVEYIAKIYDCKLDNSTDCSCFSQPRENGKGSDEKYFKYLRSLCAVHPINTNRYRTEYQSGVLEWCPTVFPVHNKEVQLLFRVYPLIEKADFIAVVYKDDVESVKYIPISIGQIFSYLEKRYNQIRNVIEAIDAYNQKYLEELKKTRICTFKEFPSYDEYLRNLDIEIKKRYNYCSSEAKKWAAVLRTTFPSKEQAVVLEKYKEALKQYIVQVHNALETMDCVINPGFRLDFFDIYSNHNLNKYYYELGKLPDLLPSNEFDKTSDWSFSFLDDDEETLEGYGDTDYARDVLRVVASALEDVFVIDFSQNHWHLWLQFEVAIWWAGRCNNQ